MITDDLRDLLLADGTLTTLLPGGVYVMDEAGRNGISQVSLPNAYDADGYMTPFAVLWMRSENPNQSGHDPAERWKSVRDMLEIYLYTDGDRSYSEIDSPADRIEHDFDQQQIAVIPGAMKTAYRYYDRDLQLNNALYIRLDFQIIKGKYS